MVFDCCVGLSCTSVRFSVVFCMHLEHYIFFKVRLIANFHQNITSVVTDMYMRKYVSKS